MDVDRVHRSIAVLLRKQQDMSRLLTLDAVVPMLNFKENKEKKVNPIGFKHPVTRSKILARLATEPDLQVSGEYFRYQGVRLSQFSGDGLLQWLRGVYPMSWSRRELESLYPWAPTDLARLIDSGHVSVVRQSQLNRINPKSRGFDAELVQQVYLRVGQHATLADLLKWNATIEPVLRYMCETQTGLLHHKAGIYCVKAIEETEYLHAAPLVSHPGASASLLNRMHRFTPLTEVFDVKARLGGLGVAFPEWFIKALGKMAVDQVAEAQLARKRAAQADKKPLVRQWTNSHLKGIDGYEFMDRARKPKRQKSGSL